MMACRDDIEAHDPNSNSGDSQGTAGLAPRRARVVGTRVSWCRVSRPEGLASWQRGCRGIEAHALICYWENARACGRPSDAMTESDRGNRCG